MVMVMVMFSDRPPPPSPLRPLPIPLPFPPFDKLVQGLDPLAKEELRNVDSSYKGREYFVRWEGKAYWHCSWLSPEVLQKKSAAKLNNFIVS